ncbi:MAG: DNA-directed RNA polymerase subunit B [Candidatus Geothermarchaeales archaeon]
MVTLPIIQEKMDYDTWPLIKALFKEMGLARQHLDSYNTFIETGLNEIIKDFEGLQIQTPYREGGYGGTYEIKFGKIIIGPPRTIEHDGTPAENVHPSMCRLRGFTYAAPMTLETHLYREGQYIESREIYIGDLPVMLKSNICSLSKMSEEELISVGEDPDDPGGYFIINGSERAIVSLEDLASNGIITNVEKSGNVSKYIAKILSVRGILRTQVTVSLKRNYVSVNIPWVSASIPFVILMRALGFESDREIADAISYNEEVLEAISPSFEKASDILTSEDAITYIGNRAAFGVSKEFRDRRVCHIIDRYVFPHIGTAEEDRRRKGYFLAEMVRRVSELSLGLREPDDRDHYANKRLRLAGPLLAQVFARAFKKLLKDLKYQLERRYVSKMYIAMEAVVRPSYVSSRLYKALATGTWSIRTTGVTQLLDRTNFLSTLSHLRRLQSPLSRTRPQFEARELHASHLGRVCPVESPEGQNIGLVKNLALSAIVSKERPSDLILEVMYSLGVVDVLEADEALWREGAKVFLNGNFVGFIQNPEHLVQKLRVLRRRLSIPEDVGVTLKKGNYEGVYDEVYVDCDAGRVLRPLIIVEKGEPLISKDHIEAVKQEALSWRDLLKMGLIELIDASEEHNIVSAFRVEDLTPNHTHLEISPYLFFGVTGSFIPFAEHNQSPRNSYEAAMAKQALGVPFTNFPLRADSRAHLLVYPQLPLVQTRMTEILGINDRPIGQNFIVAILSMESYNMEDAVILNKASVDRGLGHSIFYQTYKAEARRYVGGTKDTFEIPSSDIKDYVGDAAYRLLEEDGIVAVESDLQRGDVIIGRTSPPRFQEEFRRMIFGSIERRDSSVHLSQHRGIVDKVFLTTGPEGERIVHARVRERRTPELGDKFASRHGQKGVVGLLMNAEDMPYTADGVVPDLLINPHAFPSRMTVGQFLVSIAGKYAALSGRRIDGTPFISVNYEDLKEMLKKRGFESQGTEVLYDGRTGRRFKAEIFIGVVYYQKLHHMVADKMHARAHGPVQMLTRQPTEGRSRGGGLRIGEMEKDTFVAYGASAVIQERLLESSDKAPILICTKCGLEGYYNPRTRRYICPKDGEDAPLASVDVSYAFKLLLDELKSMNIYPRLISEGEV